MPVWNAAATLPRALRSVLTQRYTDWELVVVDDGSTDDTPGILAELAGRDTRVRVLRQPHGGIVSALNAGLVAARGAWIARMDADDESHPDRLLDQVRWLEAHGKIGLVGCLVAFGGDRTRQLGYALHVDWMNGIQTPDRIQLERFVESPFAHPSVLFRRELVERHGGYRAGDFPEDYELWLRWLEAGVRMAKVPRVLFVWHDSPGRLSRVDRRYALEHFFACKAVYLGRWLARELPVGRRVLVWGAGRVTRRRAAALGAQGIRIDGYIDIDPRKCGRRYGGRPVMAPGEVPSAGEVFVLGYVHKRGARDRCRAHLVGRGFIEGRDFLVVA